MAEKTTLTRGKETLEVTEPTSAGLAALARLGWKSNKPQTSAPKRPSGKK